MSLLVAPEWLTAAHPTGVWGTAVAADALANSYTLRFSDSALLAGSNGAIFARFYENTTASSSGATQVGAQTGTFDASNGTVVQVNNPSIIRGPIQ